MASAVHDGSRTFAAATLVAAAMTWLLGHPDVVRGGAYPLAMAALCAGWVALGAVLLRTLGGACDARVARWSCAGALAIVVVGTGASAHLPVGGVLRALHAVIDTLTAGDAHAAHLVWNSGHTIVFALLAATLGTLRRRLRLERLTLLTGLVALAAGTEALQRHLPDRTPAVSDLVADLAGIVLGLLCARLGSELRYARRPAQRRFTLRLDVDRRRRARPASTDRRGARRSIGPNDREDKAEPAIETASKAVPCGMHPWSARNDGTPSCGSVRWRPPTRSAVGSLIRCARRPVRECPRARSSMPGSSGR